MRTKNKYGSLPIHCLFGDGTSPTIEHVNYFLSLAEVLRDDQVKEAENLCNQQFGVVYGDVRLARTRDGHTPLDCAIKNGKFELAIISRLLDVKKTLLYSSTVETVPLMAYICRQRDIMYSVVDLLRGKNHGVLLQYSDNPIKELPIHAAIDRNFTFHQITMLLPPLFSNLDEFIGASQEEVHVLHMNARLRALCTDARIPDANNMPLDSKSFMRKNENPIEFALKTRGTSVEVLELLILHFESLFPLHVLYDDKRTFLHWAILHDKEKRVLECLVDHSEKVLLVKSKDAKAQTPLHTFLSMHHGLGTDVLLETALLLMDSERLVLTKRNSESLTPLQVAITVNQPAPFILALIRAIASSTTSDTFRRILASTTKGKKTCALHLALYKLPQHDDVEKVQCWHEICQLLACPEVLLLQDSAGFTPLHRAFSDRRAFYNDNFSPHHPMLAYDFLIDKDKTALTTKNDCGRTPLHLAMTQHFPAHKMPLYIIDKRKKVLMKQDLQGATPLFLALSSGESMPVECMRHLIDTRQNILILPNDEGSLPLHAALRNGCECSVEQATLLLGDGHAAQILQHTPDNGRIALMQALFFKADVAMINFLLSLYSPSVLLQYDARFQTPLHIALHSGAAHSTISMLVDEQKKVLMHFDVCNDAPVHIALANGVYLPQLLFFVDEERTLLKRTKLA